MPCRCKRRFSYSRVDLEEHVRVPCMYLDPFSARPCAVPAELNSASVFAWVALLCEAKKKTHTFDIFMQICVNVDVCELHFKIKDVRNT